MKRREPPSAPTDFVALRLRWLANWQLYEVKDTSAVLGRHSQADVRVGVPEVSRRHCCVRFDDGAWRVQDMDSLNGVYVNGERVKESTIFTGDELRLGTVTFHVERGTAMSEEHEATEMFRRIAGELPEQAYRRVS